MIEQNISNRSQAFLSNFDSLIQILTDDFRPEEFNLNDVEGIFIVDIPDSQNASLDNSEEYEDDYGNEFSKYLSGSSMNQITESDPIERIMTCYDKNQINLYRDFLDLLYNCNNSNAFSKPRI